MTDVSIDEPIELRRVTVNLIPKAWDAVNTTTARVRLNRTDVINRAVQAYAFLEEEIAGGSEVLIRAKNGEMSKLRIL